MIPPASTAALRYFARNMAVPKSRRERLLHHIKRPRWRTPQTDDPLSLLLFTFLEEEPLCGRRLEDMRSVTMLDIDQDGRERLVALLFDASGETPFAVAKAQTDLETGALKPEADALREAAALLPPEWRGTIPEILRYKGAAAGEVLVVSALPGRSAWFDMMASLVPSRLIDAHFDAAARWLAGFHEATRHDELTTAKHGDYWAHNVLLDRRRQAGVVDWENFASRASRFVDLFHYALTYGIAYPWRRYKPLPAGEAFVKTFLETNAVSRAVRRYLEIYTAHTGVPWHTLRNAFHEFLVTRGAMDSAAAPLPGVRHLPWNTFVDHIDAVRDSVFS